MRTSISTRSGSRRRHNSTASPVPNLEPHAPVAAPERDAHSFCVGVLAHVGQSFLGHAEEGALQRPRKARFAERFVVDCLITFGAKLLCLHTYGCGQTEVVERGRPQVGDDASSFVYRPLDECDGILQFLLVLGRVMWAVLRKEFQASVGSSRHL